MSTELIFRMIIVKKLNIDQYAFIFQRLKE